MSKIIYSKISENSFQNIETCERNFDILDKKEILLGVMESLIQKENLEDGLQHMFHFLRRYIPVTYILYTPPYESQTVEHIYISEEGIKFFDNKKSPSYNEITKIFKHREYFNTRKTYYFSDNKTMNEFFNIIIDKIKISSPCFYFYFIYKGHVQGSIYFDAL